MSRISQKFDSLKGSGALIAFIAAGDPDLQTTEKIVLEIEKNGVDIVELGIPFSDPVADGPINQEAYLRALHNGVDVTKILETVRSIRKVSQIPIVLMTYLNPIYQRDLSHFAKEASDAGVDGVLITDLPPEESTEWKKAADEVGLDTIFLVAPTSTDERMDLAGKYGSGFIYCVSRTGVTGKHTNVGQPVQKLAERVRKHTNLPIAIGFGIASHEDVRHVFQYADGAIVGSAIVRKIADNPKNLLHEVGSFVHNLKYGN